MRDGIMGDCNCDEPRGDLLKSTLLNPRTPDCDEPRGDLYQSTLLNPRTRAQGVVTLLLDVFFGLLFLGLVYSLLMADLSAHAYLAVYVFVASNTLIWLWLRAEAQTGYQRLSEAEKQELPSTLCFPTDKDGKVNMVLWLVAFVLVPLAVLLFGGPLLYKDDDSGDDDSD
jgi:hypothetical protein